MMNGAFLRGYPVRRLRGGLDHAFNHAFGPFPVRGNIGSRSAALGRSFPALNVWDAGEELFAEAEVPGLKIDDLEILIRGQELTIQGERKVVDREGVTYHRRERGAGSFRSRVELPVEIDVDKVEATLEDGVLTLVMPKASSALPRKIEVKVKK